MQSHTTEMRKTPLEAQCPISSPVTGHLGDPPVTPAVDSTWTSCARKDGEGLWRRHLGASLPLTPD